MVRRGAEYRHHRSSSGSFGSMTKAQLTSRPFSPASQDTEFAQEELTRILSFREDIESWRVGEAIAETYLTKHRSCYFPWPDSRDERKSGSSLPGADLVGFGADDNGCCLAFGEGQDVPVRQNIHQARCMDEAGLKRQLEDLRDSKAIRDDLLKYLAYRAVLAPWKPSFEVRE